MKAIGARLARAVNRVFARSRPVLADRYHVRVLRTPREVRNALAYVLLNARGTREGGRTLSRAFGIDPASSGRWFDGCGTAGIESERRCGAPAVFVHVPGCCSRLEVSRLLDPTRFRAGTIGRSVEAELSDRVSCCASTTKSAKPSHPTPRFRVNGRWLDR